MVVIIMPTSNLFKINNGIILMIEMFQKLIKYKYKKRFNKKDLVDQHIFYFIEKFINNYCKKKKNNNNN